VRSGQTIPSDRCAAASEVLDSSEAQGSHTRLREKFLDDELQRSVWNHVVQAKWVDGILVADFQ